MSKKSNIAYVLINILCLALLIADIELKNYFEYLLADYNAYLYPMVMTNLAGPLIVCLLIVFRQSFHQKASVKTKVIIDSSSAVIFLSYSHMLFTYRYMPEVTTELLVTLCLFLVPAIYNIFSIIRTKTSFGRHLNRR